MYAALALLAAALTALAPGRRFPLPNGALFARALGQRAVVPVAVATLVAAQHAYLVLLLGATYHQRPLALMAHVPVRFIDDLSRNHLASNSGNAFALVALVESLALFALYHGLAVPTRLKLGVVAAGVLLACADALVSPAATSADMYSYVGYTLLGGHAYFPPALAFAGPYAAINGWWHTPLIPAPYGPLWLSLAAVTAGGAHTLFAKIVALRLLGALTLVATGAVLAALKLPLRVVALVALNPALVFEFVANVHNDLFAVLLLLAARYALPRNAVGGVALAATAGLVKLPFALLAAIVFASRGSLRRRLSGYGACLAVTLAGSWLWGGYPYARALVRHADDSTGGHALSMLFGTAVILKLVAFAAIGSAFVGGAFYEGAAWALPGLGAILHPWYLCWMLPYAAASETSLRNTAIALPLATLAADDALRGGALIAAVTYLAFAWSCYLLVRVLAQAYARSDYRASALTRFR